MNRLTLTNPMQGSMTLIENEFIDHHMSGANGEYIKVYLLLLRHFKNPSANLTPSGIADMLEVTEKDVVRALNYWKKAGLLDYDGSEDIPPGKNDSPRQPESEISSIHSITKYKNRKELKELLFVAEQYLGKTLSSTEVNTITYFYDELSMSADLIEYLIEYCVENGHKSIHYIQKVALSWKDQNITTVTAAKSNTVLYNKNCYAILNAYGIKGRAPAAAEVSYIRRWNEEYGLSLELIIEACNRTVNAIHQPNFEYTESILKSWIEKGVRQKSDLEALDAAHLKEKEAKKRTVSAGKPVTKNKFNNFEERSYGNMDDLARKLIQSQ